MKEDTTVNLTELIDIEYRKRKSLEIQIKSNGRVRILAPSGASSEWINRTIEKKKDWILSKLEQVGSRQDNRPKLEHGTKVLDAGVYVDLNIGVHKGLYPIERGEDSLNVQILNEWRDDKEKVSSLLIDWYTHNTRNKVGDYIDVWSKRMKIEPKVIRIKDQKKRWGSCSSKGNLNFNWRLSMAPDTVLEYVVVHELCHFYHMDHSSDFWNLVEKMIPDYKVKRNWLKEHGDQMFWLG